MVPKEGIIYIRECQPVPIQERWTPKCKHSLWQDWSWHQATRLTCSSQVKIREVTRWTMFRKWWFHGKSKSPICLLLCPSFHHKKQNKKDNWYGSEMEAFIGLSEFSSLHLLTVSSLRKISKNLLIKSN